LVGVQRIQSVLRGPPWPSHVLRVRILSCGLSDRSDGWTFARLPWDIDAILRDGRIDLSTALASAQALYGPQFNPQIALKALSFFDEGNLRRLAKATKDRLAKAAREVDLDRLPTIVRAVRPRGTGGGPFW
jgi:hypothetical protein